MYTASNIASFFLHKAEFDRKIRRISNLQLQKLVYISFGWHTICSNEDLFQDRIEAWRYGPVIPSLYYKFNAFNDNPISVRTIDNDLHVYLPSMDDIGSRELQFPLIMEEGTFIKEFLDMVFDEYIKKPPHVLVDLTHGKATPWDKVYIPGAKMEIPKPLIREYYGKLAQP